MQARFLLGRNPLGAQKNTFFGLEIDVEGAVATTAVQLC